MKIIPVSTTICTKKLIYFAILYFVHIALMFVSTSCNQINDKAIIKESVSVLLNSNNSAISVRENGKDLYQIDLIEYGEIEYINKSRRTIAEISQPQFEEFKNYVAALIKTTCLYKHPGDLSGNISNIFIEFEAIERTSKMRYQINCTKGENYDAFHKIKKYLLNSCLSIDKNSRHYCVK